MPHSTITGGEPGRWTARDRLLAVALTLHEQGLCGGCGHPRSISFDPTREGEFELQSETCLACEARDREQSGEHTPKPQPGAKTFVVHVGPG